jgi:hypothetical protein
MSYTLILSKLADGEVLRRVGKGFAGAEISTLTPAGHWLPDATATRDLGSTSVRWRNAYLGNALDVQVDNATVNGVTRGITLSHTTSATAQAGVGAGVLLRAESGAGTLRSAGAVDAVHTDVTDGAEVSELVLSAARNGSLLEAARFGAAASAVNSLYVVASASGQPVELRLSGNDANCGLALSGKGTGSLSLRAGNGATRIAVNNTGIGLHGATPVAQGAAIANATDAGSVITQLNLLLAHLRLRGDIAT